MAAMRLLAACFGAVALALRGLHERDEDQDRPVSKVITLLQDLQKTLEKEHDDDRSAYNKMACECSTGQKELAHAIEVADSHITKLGGDVENLVGQLETLNTQRGTYEEDLLDAETELQKVKEKYAQDTEALKDRTSSTQEAISALKSAIVVLQKHQSFLQRPSVPLARTAAVLRTQLQRDPEVFAGVLTPSQRETLSAFMAVELGEDPSTPLPKYESESGEVFATLERLLEQFNTELANQEKEEEIMKMDFAALHGAKTQEIASLKGQIVDTNISITNAEGTQKMKEEDKEDMEGSRAKDAESLRLLEETCALTDEQWEARQSEREKELTAVANALQILSEDDAHDTFTRTFKPSFLQIAAKRHAEARKRAAMVLSRTAMRVNSPALLALASQTKAMKRSAGGEGDGANEDPDPEVAEGAGQPDGGTEPGEEVSFTMDFTEVNNAIDSMVLTLRADSETEVSHRDTCIADMDGNDHDTRAKVDERDRVLRSISNLQLDIESLEAEEADLTKAVETLESEEKTAVELRELEKTEFEKTIADQEETERLVNEAKDALNDYYASTDAAGDAGDPAEVQGGFDNYKENQIGHGIIDMLEQLVKEAQRLKAEAEAEEAAQINALDAYKKEIAEDILEKEARIKVIEEEITNKNAEIGQEGQEDGHIATVVGINATLESYSETSATLHSQCDFLLKNFELRQKARNEEIDALGQAKAMLAGARFDDE